MSRYLSNRWLTLLFALAGYPHLSDTVAVLLALQEGGADIIELGIPHTGELSLIIFNQKLCKLTRIPRSYG